MTSGSLPEPFLMANHVAPPRFLCQKASNGEWSLGLDPSHGRGFGAVPERDNTGYTGGPGHLASLMQGLALLVQRSYLNPDNCFGCPGYGNRKSIAKPSHASTVKGLPGRLHSAAPGQARPLGPQADGGRCSSSFKQSQEEKSPAPVVLGSPTTEGFVLLGFIFPQRL